MSTSRSSSPSPAPRASRSEPPQDLPPGDRVKAMKSFAEFYPFYLGEHRDRTCRRLHFVGSSLGLICLVAAVVTQNAWWVLVGLLCGYAFAWIGHFGFEKNRPASFKRPLYSFLGDWAMYRDVWLGRIKL